MFEDKKQWRTILVKTPRLVTLEGIDGSGKSTQTRNLSDLLSKEGVKVARYHYTSKDNFWGGVIRGMYSNGSYKGLGPLKSSFYVQELLYALSARANLKRINGSLSESELLLSDRSIITAYATHLDRLPHWFLDLAEPRLVPELAIYLDIPPEAAIERIGDRTVKYDDENLAELAYFRQCYERIIGKERPRRLAQTQFVRVDGLMKEADITDHLYDIIRKEALA